MNEVKMALDVPTLAALYEQNLADDDWQAWYGRATTHTEPIMLNPEQHSSRYEEERSDILLTEGNDRQMTII